MILFAIRSDMIYLIVHVSFLFPDPGFYCCFGIDLHQNETVSRCIFSPMALEKIVFTYGESASTLMQITSKTTKEILQCPPGFLNFDCAYFAFLSHL